MEVRVNKSTETVEWVVSGRTICIHNQYALYAFTQRDYLIKVKELHGQSRSGFSAYDKDGELIFSFIYLENQVLFMGKTIVLDDGVVISVDYEENKQVLVILKENEKKRSVLLYRIDGERIAEINSPRDFQFVALKKNSDSIMVTGRGRTDRTSDAFGRNDWNFKLNFENYYVERDVIVQ